MPIGTKTPRMKHTEFLLPVEEFERLRAVAARKNISVSQFVRMAVRKMLDAERERAEYVGKMRSIVGIGESSNPDASVKHDEILYGH